MRKDTRSVRDQGCAGEMQWGIYRMKRHFPLLVAVGLLLGTTLVVLVTSLYQNAGHFIYALDDPYIHMAMARNLAKHGLWAIDNHTFTSSSSSPLWVLLLSLIYYLLGANVYTPLVLNLLFSTASLTLVYVVLGREFRFGPILNLSVLLAIVYFTPLVPLAFSGLEHSMQIFFSLLMVFLSAKALSDEGKHEGEVKLLLVVAALLTATRYEGAFLVSVIGVMFILKRRWLASVSVLGAGAFPGVVYGIISVSNGWNFLPNSILLKGTMPSLSSLSRLIDALGGTAFRGMFENSNSDILFLFISALVLLTLTAHEDGKPNWKVQSGILIVVSAFFLKQVLPAADIVYEIETSVLTAGIIVMLLDVVLRFSTNKACWNEPSIMLSLFIGATFLHMEFARTGWFFRYEAYLVVFGVFAIVVSINDIARRKFGRGLTSKSFRLEGAILITAILLLPLSYPLFQRARISLEETPQATSNIYDQQYQMASFLKEFYSGKAVAANDIGAIDYFADIRCTDLWGLASKRVARSKMDHSYDTRDIYEIGKDDGVRLAVVFDSWFKWYGGIPRQWIKVGEWTIQNNVVCGDSTVSFYAVNPAGKAGLIKALVSFSSRLPASVVQAGEYVRWRERRKHDSI